MIPDFTLEEIKLLEEYFRINNKPGRYLLPIHFESLENFYKFVNEDSWREVPIRAIPLHIPFENLPLHIGTFKTLKYWTESVISWRLRIGK